MPIFEIVMLLCFGLSWPISISKALLTHRVSGKSPLFMAIICVGYLSGMAHRLQFWTGALRDWVILLYALNFVMVAFDLYLYYHFSGREQAALMDEAG